MIESFKPGAFLLALVNHELQLFIIHRVGDGRCAWGRFAGPGVQLILGYFSSGGLGSTSPSVKTTPQHSSGKVSWACWPMSSKFLRQE